MFSIKKEYILIIFLFAALVAVAAVYFVFFYEKKITNLQEAKPLFNPSTASSGALPDIGEMLSNPLEKMPEVNPVEQANPFAKVKFNPFR